MHPNALILEQLIEEDYGLKASNSRYVKSVEHDSLVIDRERGIYFFNSQDLAGDPLSYLMQVRGMTFVDARLYLSRFSSYEGTHVYTIRNSESKTDVVVYPALVDAFFELGKTHRDYFHRRGISDLTLDKFRCGWYNDFSMIPFYVDGTFRNFQMRRDLPTKRIKSYYKDVGPLLFNEDVLRLSEVIFMVEGPVDAMAMDQHGLPTISTNSGGAFLPDWLVKFVNTRLVYLLMDNDKAGNQEADRLAKILGKSRCRIYTFADFEEPGYDPVDFFNDGYNTNELMYHIEKGMRYAV